MSLAIEDIQFIKDHLGEWLTEQSLGRPGAVYEIELRERMVRVEEELKHQRELIKTILVEMAKRFEIADKRLENMQLQMDERFETMQQQMDKRFEAMQQWIDKRFEAVDKRFEAAQQQMDKRFEELTRRIDRFMFWSFGLTLSVGALLLAGLRLWP